MCHSLIWKIDFILKVLLVRGTQLSACLSIASGPAGESDAAVSLGEASVTQRQVAREEGEGGLGPGHSEAKRRDGRAEDFCRRPRNHKYSMRLRRKEVERSGEQLRKGREEAGLSQGVMF